MDRSKGRYVYFSSGRRSSRGSDLLTSEEICPLSNIDNHSQAVDTNLINLNWQRRMSVPADDMGPKMSCNTIGQWRNRGVEGRRWCFVASPLIDRSANKLSNASLRRGNLLDLFNFKMILMSRCLWVLRTGWLCNEKGHCGLMFHN